MSSRKISPLLQPCTLGASIPLRNRICMGAMTRNRCIDNNKPTEASVRHYADRARDGAGLIVAEGIFIYFHGTDYLHAPVMFKEEHAHAWQKVTHAVHHEGGKIFFQAWHAGRAQNENMPMLQDNNYPVLAPSKITAAGGKYRPHLGKPGHTSHITEIIDVNEIFEQYRNSVSLAKKAGFDGVEILAQGGYLLHNFLLSRTNQRTDKYGGSVENCCRFVLEIVDAIVEVWGSTAVGIKICPCDNMFDTAVPYEEVTETYSYLVPKLVDRKLAYINLSRRGCDTGPSQYPVDTFVNTRPAGTELPPGYEPLDDQTSLMVNQEYTVAEAERLLQAEKIDLVCFGRPFIYNPDLVTRIRRKIPFATNDRGTQVSYGPYEDPNENYNDWPYAARE
ncbi:FMN-linked oxidoreductase [Bimuria novae-zelandiae CBS 107.79]|uniref:FMN-linked oxidoreductase n=1 Tax=Bimuria novae-zelandiae CBS 107.79 TaxID=1447943 RepID=A0A6A5VMU6_9PLEO|nr:FMN-linked oxidoreductase [Bimuria novae-zelandiae CBS 107.79]